MGPHPLAHVDALADVDNLPEQVFEQIDAGRGWQARYLCFVDATAAALATDRLVLDAQQIAERLNAAVAGALEQVQQHFERGFGVGSGSMPLDHAEAQSRAQTIEPIRVQARDEP